MLLPLLIGFGLLAALLLSDGKRRRDDKWVVGWFIILVAFGLLVWGYWPVFLGFDEGIYR